VVLTTKSKEEAGPNEFPVSYARLPSMVEVGDTIFLGRYLVTGADESSLFMEVGGLLSRVIVSYCLPVPHPINRR